ncbi:RNA exonuclease 5-like [Dreissena polymorpha]|uniref:Exonuclease domain-containing protein n=1 Tax=Dreissena polymorpha TaxID=45954 RepID=A0A9D4RF92_DREPO|nr:RNA exonuclease 5-like [Dreissena polymorpha]KAH3864150.1 hypothetical protein DPMN_027165 [Dreissena polymorpha]
MSKRKDERTENKKRKAMAFLALVKSTEDNDTSPAKKSKVESHTGTTGSCNNGPIPQKEKSMSDEMYDEFKKKRKENKELIMQRPKVFLTLDELTRDNPHHVDDNGVKIRPPLFMSDVQHLLMFAVLQEYSSFKPRWCRLLRVGKITKVVAVVLDSLSAQEYERFPGSLPTLHQAFDIQADIIAPVQYASSVREDIMNVPIRLTSQADVVQLVKQKQKDGIKISPQFFKNTVAKTQLWQSYKNLKALMSNPLQSLELDSSAKPDSEIVAEAQNGLQNIGEDSPVSTFEQDKFDRRWLMLNSAQMAVEHIPMPGGESNRSFYGFKYTKKSYSKITRKSPLFAIDCEMIQTKASKMDLARVSIVDENLQVVYDSFVKPRAPVIDYVTQFSGITEEILAPVTTRVEDVQKVMMTCLPPDAILCGQSISSDLNSMKLFHPYIIDTSVIYNLTGTRQKTGLKKLTSIFLGRDIQSNSGGHCSVEDAMATMELVLLKLRNEMNFGDIKIKNVKTTDYPETGLEHSGRDEDEGLDDSQLDNSCMTVTRSLELNGVSDKMKRKRLFFQQEGCKFIENFLHRMEKHSKKGKIIDEPASVADYPVTVPVVSCSSDKESSKQTLAQLAENTFCFTHLYGYRNFLRTCGHGTDQDKPETAEELKKCLWKLDRRFWKILMGLPERSLFVVILPGREENGVVYSAKTFAKIT